MEYVILHKAKNDPQAIAMGNRSAEILTSLSEIHDRFCYPNYNHTLS